jgi:hypothetical protein
VGLGFPLSHRGRRHGYPNHSHPSTGTSDLPKNLLLGKPTDLKCPQYQRVLTQGSMGWDKAPGCGQASLVAEEAAPGKEQEKNTTTPTFSPQHPAASPNLRSQSLDPTTSLRMAASSPSPRSKASRQRQGWGLHHVLWLLPPLVPNRSLMKLESSHNSVPLLLWSPLSIPLYLYLWSWPSCL